MSHLMNHGLQRRLIAHPAQRHAPARASAAGARWPSSGLQRKRQARRYAVAICFQPQYPPGYLPSGDAQITITIGTACFRYLATGLLNDAGDVNFGIHDLTEFPPMVSL